MATLLNLLNASIECNNLGVVLLNAGDLENALDSFMTAAKLMHPVSKQVPTTPATPTMDHMMDHDDAYSATPSSPSSSSPPTTGFEIPNEVRRIAQESADSSAMHGKLQPGTENIFINAKPMQLEPAHCLPTSCTFESAVVVYNMGLVYQLQASEACLHRAVFLYDMAFKLCFPLTSAKAATIAMGALNNAGLIFHQVGEYMVSKRYLDTLRLFIMKLPPTCDSHCLDERHQFLLNAVLLRAPTVASAA